MKSHTQEELSEFRGDFHAHLNPGSAEKKYPLLFLLLSLRSLLVFHLPQYVSKSMFYYAPLGFCCFYLNLWGHHREGWPQKDPAGCSWGPCGCSGPQLKGGGRQLPGGRPYLAASSLAASLSVACVRAWELEEGTKGLSSSVTSLKHAKCRVLQGYFSLELHNSPACVKESFLFL